MQTRDLTTLGPVTGAFVRATSRGREPTYRASQDGCAVSRSCLDCPLPRCRYDDPYWRVHLLHDQIRRARQVERFSVRHLAAQFGLSERQIWRIIGGGG